MLLILAGVALATLVGHGNIIGNAENAVGKYNNSVLMEQIILQEINNFLGRNESNENIVDGVVIPNGFYYVGGTKDTGIIISDNEEDYNKGASYEVASSLKGNQFVWIPVKEYKTTDFDNSGAEYTEEIDENTIKENEEIERSIEKYKGFYIGRYETGIENNNIVVKQGKEANIVNYEEAVETSRKMYETSEIVTSTLVHGKQWDAVMNFISKKFDIKNSSQYGNYADYTMHNEEAAINISRWVTEPDDVNNGFPVGILNMTAQVLPEEIFFPSYETEGSFELVVGTSEVSEPGYATIYIEITDTDDIIKNKEEFQEAQKSINEYIEPGSTVKLNIPKIKNNINLTENEKNATIKIYVTMNAVIEGNIQSGLTTQEILEIKIKQSANKKQTSGNNEKWQTNNIYDMAGNNYEWTVEKSGENYVVRGGQASNAGTTDYISKRNLVTGDSLYGYRIALYLK